ncbi:MAG: fibronectin type III domain-containing protein [Candidatus Paceibacterota bacterium]|jgi:hypothetical protein
MKKYFIALALVALVIVPVVTVKAATVDELLAQIAALTAQINSLQSQVSSLSSGSTNSISTSAGAKPEVKLISKSVSIQPADGDCGKVGCPTVLRANFKVQVTNKNTNPIYVWPEAFWQTFFTESSGKRVSDRCTQSADLSTANNISTRAGGNGVNYSLLEPGKTYNVNVSLSCQTNHLLAGAYTGVLNKMFYRTNETINVNGLPDFEVSLSLKTSRKTIVGEQGPYISSVSINSQKQVVINGERLSKVNMVNIGGYAISSTGSNFSTYVRINKNGKQIIADVQKEDWLNWQKDLVVVYVATPVGESNRVAVGNIISTISEVVTPQVDHGGLYSVGESDVYVNIRENQTISSAFTLTGTASNVFEGQWGNVKLYDSANNLLGTKNLVVGCDYGKTNCPFTPVSFNVNPKTGFGYFIFSIDNQSDLRQYDRRYRLNIVFSDVPVIQPSITTISPNGGETFKIGDTISVHWASKNLPPSDRLNVYLYSPIIADVPGHSFTTSAVNTSYQFPLLNNLTPGSYKVNVCDHALSPAGLSGKSLCDISDDYFTIVSANSTLSAPTNLKADVSSDASGNKVKLSWNPVVGAEQYVVEKYIENNPTNPSNHWVRINIGYSILTDTNFVDSSSVIPGKKYDYRVWAARGSGPDFIRSDYSNQVSARISSASSGSVSDSISGSVPTGKLVINSISGSGNLIATGVNKTWVVETTVPSNASVLNYSVDWGDGLANKTAGDHSVSSNFKSTFSASHTYNTAGVYTVRMDLSAGGQSISRVFKVVVAGLTVKPAIVLLSPNGRETWYTGTTKNITWSSKGLPADSKIDLEIYEDGKSKDLATTITSGLTPTLSSYAWGISTWPTPDKKYRVVVKVIDKNGSFIATDESNSSFLLASPKGANISAINQMASALEAIKALAQTLR